MSSSRRRKPIDLPPEVLRAKRALLEHLLTSAPDLEEAGNLMSDLQSLLYSSGHKQPRKASPSAFKRTTVEDGPTPRPQWAFQPTDTAPE